MPGFIRPTMSRHQQLNAVGSSRSGTQISARSGIANSRRHHPDDGRWIAVQPDRAPDDARVAAEHPLPEPVADHADAVVVRRILTGDERSTQEWRRSEHAEEIERYRCRIDANGIAGPGDA